MKIRMVTSMREFDELAGLWTTVTKHAATPSLLLSHEWFACCWRTAGANRSRELWVIEDAAGPLALVPLLRWRGRYRGLPARMLQLMHPPGAPIVDFPVGRAREQVVAFLLHALRERDDWDVFLMPGLPEDSPTWKAFLASSDSGLPWQIAERVSLPQVDVSARHATLVATLDAIRHPVNGHGRGQNVSVEEHRDLDARSPVLEDLLVMIADRPPRTVKLPEAPAPQVRRFLRELTSRASANGWLSLWALRLEGAVVATEYQVTADGHVHVLRRDADGGHGAAYQDFLSASIVEALLDRPEAQTYSWLPGDRTPRPFLGAATPREAMVVEVFAAGRYGHVLHGLETRLMPLARRLTGRPERPCA